ncbi:hypothetical protein EYF80_024727 [Liparis tanakae]|uniref:Uncharacterized protein n=1 Tax=Liparis tanakae TaxID=230148 RepID=A0A4Z2HGI6_9TELE|nr:hypothetical protein EYF80_024727 [Liparis tanakae]
MQQLQPPVSPPSIQDSGGQCAGARIHALLEMKYEEPWHMSKPHLFLRRFFRFCLFFSCFNSLALSSSDNSSTNCSSRLMPCIFSTAI